MSTRDAADDGFAQAKHRTPGQAIRAYCLWCCAESRHEVKLCPAAHCALWPWRFGRRPETVGLAREASTTATRAINLRCRDCYEHRGDCGVSECDLHPIRAKAFCARSAPSTEPVQRIGALARIPGPSASAASPNRTNAYILADPAIVSANPEPNHDCAFARRPT